MDIPALLYTWVLFVVAFIAVLFPVLAFLIPLMDEKQNAGKMSYWLVCSVLLSGFIPIIGQSIIDYNILLYIWKGLLVLICLCSFIPCVKYTSRNIHFLLGAALTLSISICPFIYYGSLIPDSYTPLTSYLVGNYPTSIITVCLPLIVAGILIGYLLKPTYKTRSILYNGDTISYSRLDGNEGIIRQNMKYDRLNSQLDVQINKLSSFIDQLGVNMLLAKYPGNEVNMKADKKSTALMSKLSDDLSYIKSHLYQYKIMDINDDQDVLVRELSHFMATPLATIDASIKNLLATVKTKNEDKLLENASRITSAVSICTGILSTYREIFAQGNAVNGGNLIAMINSSFEVFNAKEGKKLKLQLHVKEKYDGISNYYVLSTVLPILSNAVTASRPDTTVEVKEKNGIVSISNTYEGNIDINNFDIDGYSSKEGHRGMGLFTVRHLLARRKLGTLTYSIQGNRVVFEIPIIPSEQ